MSQIQLRKSAEAPLVLLLGPSDNVAVAVRDLPAGVSVSVAGATVVTSEPIGFGHKLAIASIAKGMPVRKYGEIIGQASSDIAIGAHVHVHNVVSARLPGPGASEG